jgi:hypothetical protein
MGVRANVRPGFWCVWLPMGSLWICQSQHEGIRRGLHEEGGPVPGQDVVNVLRVEIATVAVDVSVATVGTPLSPHNMLR